MEFFHNPDEYLYEAGDLWPVGVSLEPNNIRNLLISTDQSGGGGPILRLTPLGLLSLSTGCVFDAPTIRQNGTTLDSRFILKSGDESVAGNKTLTGLTRLEGGVYTRRHIVSNTTTVSTFVLGSLLRLASGPAGYTVTIPSPSAHPGGRIAIHLQQSGVNILTPSGVFAGMGDGAAMQTLTIATHSAFPELISDGDNWLLCAGFAGTGGSARNRRTGRANRTGRAHRAGRSRGTARTTRAGS